MQNTYVAIMAGGIGSRFWPGSRTHRPKQFLDIMGVGKSLIRMTFERFLEVCPKENIYILTNELYKEQVLEHLPELTESQVLCEPSRNNTAPCIAYTAFKLQGLNPNANFIVAPSDHVILNEPAFVQTVNKALNFVAENQALVTLGIQPTRPDTGYGYINYSKDNDADGVHEVFNFMEKPILEKAKEYLASGNFLWNAGIFIWNVNTIVDAFKLHAPDIFSIFSGIQSRLNTEEEQAVINEYYPKNPKISIDFAIMERADNVYTIPSDFGWSDLGTWNSLHVESSGKDDNNNLAFSDNVMLEESKNCLIRTPEDKLVVIRGLDNFIIVDEGDVLLIYPKSEEQDIKRVTGEVKEQTGDQFL
ncbi:MAG: mannose-1-phosphate guanylyltransferase [Bacteroidota bacterium]